MVFLLYRLTLEAPGMMQHDGLSGSYVARHQTFQSGIGTENSARGGRGETRRKSQNEKPLGTPTHAHTRLASFTFTALLV